MLFSDLTVKLSLFPVVGEIPNSFEGVYAGDLLSRAMSRVEAGNLWITIMNNMNVVAVASLTEAAAVILAEGVKLMPEAEEAARENNITVLSSDLSVYEICRVIGSIDKGL